MIIKWIETKRNEKKAAKEEEQRQQIQKYEELFQEINKKVNDIFRIENRSFDLVEYKSSLHLSNLHAGLYGEIPIDEEKTGTIWFGNYKFRARYNGEKIVVLAPEVPVPLSVFSTYIQVLDEEYHASMRFGFHMAKAEIAYNKKQENRKKGLKECHSCHGSGESSRVVIIGTAVSSLNSSCVVCSGTGWKKK